MKVCYYVAVILIIRNIIIREAEYLKEPRRMYRHTPFYCASKIILFFFFYDERRCTYVLHIPGLPLQRGCQKIFPGSASERTQLPDPMETILTLVDRATAAPPDGAAKIALHLLRGA